MLERGGHAEWGARLRLVLLYPQVAKMVSHTVLVSQATHMLLFVF